MGRIQNMRMERAKRAFKEEMFPNDLSRSFYVDHAGNAMGFSIARADGNVLSYNGETGRYEPFEVLPEDGAVNIPPYFYRGGKIVDALSEDPAKNIQKYTCFYARYFCGEFDSIITEELYRRLEASDELYMHDTLDYEPIFDGKIYPSVSESASAQISLFGYHYDDDRRTVPSKAELAVAGIELTMNTKLGYLYRDADNYKVWNECVLEGTLTQEQKQKILDCRYEGEWFIPKLVGLPEERFGAWDDQADHPYFELDENSFTETALPPTVKMKAVDLVSAFERCSQTEWTEPAPRHPSLEDRMAVAAAKAGNASGIGSKTGLDGPGGR